MKHIEASLNNALINQGWLYGQRYHRIGNPYLWVDTEQIGSYNKATLLSGAQAFLQYLSLHSEQYLTPKEITSTDFDHMRKHVEETIRESFHYFLPFLESSISEYENYICCTALVRTQDYSAVRTLASELPRSPMHLDIGPGLGTAAIASLHGLKGCFYALEAFPMSYAIQRDFFRFLTTKGATYFDVIELENFFPNFGELANKLRQSAHTIKHIPSWHFGLVDDNHIDLVTANWVLNEVSTAGILWVIANTSRVLRPGGYLYIRDSGILKPLRHSINYDELLIELGFTLFDRLEVRNRIDYYGIPRIYKNTNPTHYTFDELCNKVIGKFDIPAWGGVHKSKNDEHK